MIYCYADAENIMCKVWNDKFLQISVSFKTTKLLHVFVDQWVSEWVVS